MPLYELKTNASFSTYPAKGIFKLIYITLLTRKEHKLKLTQTKFVFFLWVLFFDILLKNIELSLQQPGNNLSHKGKLHDQDYKALCELSLKHSQQK